MLVMMRFMTDSSQKPKNPKDTPSPEQMAIQRFVSNDFSVRASFVNATHAVRHMQSIQNAMPLASLGVGRAMIGALLMASHLKEGQQVGVMLKGNGPLGSLYAEASFEGHVRGYCPNPTLEATEKADQLKVGEALGEGTLSVTRHAPFQKQPFHGTVELVSGEVGQDIAHYLHQSQQIRSIVQLGVYLDIYGKVKSAGGILVEVMPGVEDDAIQKIEKNHLEFIKKHQSLSGLLLHGGKSGDVVDPLLNGIPFTEIPHPYQVEYYCPCTTDRVKRALTVLGLDELDDMISENKTANKTSQVTCQICGKQYEFTVSDLNSVRNELARNSMH
jgi:molecular chaperone Hsp33